MVKIITLNIETTKHYATVLPFLEKEDADVVCLQEVPDTFAVELNTRGYQTVYAPMFIKVIDNEEVRIGVMLASKHPFSAIKNYYHGNEKNITIYDKQNKAETRALAYILGEVKIADDLFSIATTHMTDPEDGKEDDFQTLLTEKLLISLAQKKPHCLCGDFNMPRGFNALYEEVLKHYTDTIPSHYQSSLDKNLHRLGNRTDLNAPIFEKYMVDYIFTQPPYIASDVRLQFGISDHAAVIATLKKSE